MGDVPNPRTRRFQKIHTGGQRSSEGLCCMAFQCIWCEIWGKRKCCPVLLFFVLIVFRCKGETAPEGVNPWLLQGNFYQRLPRPSQEIEEFEEEFNLLTKLMVDIFICAGRKVSIPLSLFPLLTSDSLRSITLNSTRIIASSSIPCQTESAGIQGCSAVSW